MVDGKDKVAEHVEVHVVVDVEALTSKHLALARTLLILLQKNLEDSVTSVVVITTSKTIVGYGNFTKRTKNKLRNSRLT